MRPGLAKAFRYVAKKERRQLSDLLQDMFSLWLRKERPGRYEEVNFDDDE